MNKIIIKEHNEIVSDIQRALTMIPVVLNNKDTLVHNATTNNSIETECIYETNESKIILHIDATYTTTGGELQRHRTYDTPEEYSDVEISIETITDVSYSEEFKNGQQTDIDTIEISEFITDELFDIIEKFLIKFIN